MHAVHVHVGAVLAIVFAGLALVGPVSAEVPPPAPYQPGDQVWTSEPPVSNSSFPLDPAWVTLPPKSPPPWQPGDQVWTSEPPVTELAGPLSDGCTRVPASGYIGPGVYAPTSAKYSVLWYWSGSSSGQPFHWYIYTSANLLKAHGYSAGGGGSQSVTANNHYWKVQNQGTVGQAWNVCWAD